MKLTFKDYALAAGYIAFVWIAAAVCIVVAYDIIKDFPDEMGEVYHNPRMAPWLAASLATAVTVWWIWFRRN